ncbi:MAG: hypothetical protein K9J25_13430 [Bacteroidales bacterium]|nr:hypothetical protein [Bacteroidales bacterium]
MKRIIILSTSILFLLLINAFPQVVEESSIYRNQVGIQFNPKINERLLSTGGFGLIETVSSVRYGYRITKNLTSGFELVCRFPILTNSSYREQSELFNYFVYRIGIVTRYSFLTEKRFQVFAEVSPYFSHAYKEVWSSADPIPYRNEEFGCYAAPGVTLYSKSRRVSFDLYSEFSITGHTMLSYKVNFNF